MPLYVFTCTACGPFELARPMAEAGAAARCPGCAAEGRRVFTAPGLAHVATAVRSALDLEEKSAHEPAVLARKGGRPLPHRHAAAPPWVLAH